MTYTFIKSQSTAHVHTKMIERKVTTLIKIPVIAVNIIYFKQVCTTDD